MKEFKYEVKPNESHNFKGYITVKVPRYKERMALLRETNIKITDKGEVEAGAEKFDLAIKLAEIAEDHIAKVSVKRGEEEFNTYEDLEYLEEGTALISEVGSMVISGIKMGKPSEARSKAK